MIKKIKYLFFSLLSALMLMGAMTVSADDCDHDWEYSDKIAATCNDQGYTLYTCSICGKTKKEDYVNALGHDYEWKANNNGTHTGTCTRCGKQVSEYCSEYYKDYVTKPTCVEKGYTSHICSKCGYVLVDTYLDPLGHNYVWTNNGDGTCSGICTRDSSHVVTQSHDYETIVVDPTCTTSGYTAHICKDCSYEVDDDYVAATGHDYAYTSNGNGTHTGVCKNNPSHTTKANCTHETTVVAPTCEEQGYTLHTCTVCGYSYKDNYKAALGHSHVYTSSNDGYHYVQCENDPSENYREKCSYTETVIAPTCEEAGYTLYKCTECGYSYRGNYVAALGHDYTWVSANDGTHVGTCNNDSSHIAREQCNYITETTAATATSSGYTTHICSVCGYSYTDGYVAPLGHDYKYTDLGNGTHRVTDNNDSSLNYIENCTYTETVVNPTCTSQGYTLHTCQKCGASYKDKYTAALGHNYVYTSVDEAAHKGICENDSSHTVIEAHTEVTKVVAPTCTSKGYTLHTCTVCGYSYKDTYKAKLGHNYVFKSNKDGTHTKTCQNDSSHVKTSNCTYTKKVVAPTCTKKGYTVYTCKYCGYSYKGNYTAKLGHTYKWVIDKEAQVGIAGSKHKECTVCGKKLASVEIPAKKAGTLLPRVTDANESQLVIKWNSLTGATKYVVYGTTCGDYEFKKITSTTETSTVVTGLEKGTYYKYYVVAYNGKVKIRTSELIHATTKGGVNTNPTKITVSKDAYTLKVGATRQLKATVTVGTYEDYHTTLVRYKSSNTSVATVSGAGVVTAKKKGTCKIYVYTLNGKYTKVTITVK
ncbi:MAG: Ig-like domain-containing protein [Clostridiales bacterium]|nr:Ig-like domain-containing protein [Clostridiales bacterium]